MATVGTLDHIGGPGLVVEAAAAFWALHPAVTRKEGAAVAEGKAVGLVPTEKLLRRHIHHWHCDLVDDTATRQSGDRAPQLWEVLNHWVARSDFVVGGDGGACQPGHVTVADQRVPGQEEHGGRRT